MRSITFLALFISFAASACPDLNGTYTKCELVGWMKYDTVLVITQNANQFQIYEKQNGGVEQNSTVLADGSVKTTVTPFEQGSMTGDSSDSCTESELVNTTVTTIEYGDFKQVKTTKNSIFKKAEGLYMLKSELVGSTFKTKSLVICQ